MVTIVLMIAGEEGIAIKELYYVLMKAGLGNVKQCKTMIRHQQVKVNNQMIEDIHLLVDDNDRIMVNHHQIKWPFVYYMLNKPKGYICASHDQKWPCVNELITDKDCYCLGRLDKDTTGLLIMTNDVSLSKRLLLPKNHVEKTYCVKVDHLLSNDLIESFVKGVVIDDHVLCRSAQLTIINQYECYVTLSEGKYHQVKKMFLSCGYRVIELKRMSFAGILLDENLNYGEYRCLNKNEFQKLEI